MNYEEFISIIRQFCNSPDELEEKNGVIFFEAFEQLIEINVKLNDSNEVIVMEDGGPNMKARDWIAKRLAHLDLLANKILDRLKAEANFVRPRGRFLDALYNNYDDKLQDVDDVPSHILSILPKGIPGNSSVLYLTSDAGEGKTTIINEISREQATRYLNKKTSRLIVPIALGGRSFLGLDDVIVATLVNQFKFRYMDFNCFLAMVKHGFILLVLDGFEEMFVEKGSGDAISSLGHLLQRVNNRGNFLIAARKAYFEYQRVNTQARLFDSLKGTSVVFSKITVSRWGKNEFLAYCAKRKLKKPDSLYSSLVAKYDEDHSLITRPVLVKRLVDLVEEDTDLSMLLDESKDPFGSLVDSILNREANEKWLFHGGEAKRPLLTLDEHYELLELIAMEMWQTRTELLSTEILGTVAEIFCEDRQKSPKESQQIIERTKQYPLLNLNNDGSGKYSFDHQEFYNFFLGKAIATAIINEHKTDVRNILQQGDLVDFSLETATKYLARSDDTESIITKLCHVSSESSLTSFVKANSGALIIETVKMTNFSNITLDRFVFPVDSLEQVRLERIEFKKCYFRATGFNGDFISCKFIECQFEDLDVGSVNPFDTSFIDCEISSVRTSNHTLYSPKQINNFLCSKGFVLPHTIAFTEKLIPDKHMEVFEKSLRVFMRLTEVNENTFKIKLGVSGPLFLKEVIPILLKTEIFKEVDYEGSGKQRRFKLNVDLSLIQRRLEKSQGNFQSFVDLFQ